VALALSRLYSLAYTHSLWSFYLFMRDDGAAVTANGYYTAVDQQQ
jgi:hypothetical protein